jgi:DNA-binding response OmpR family regulator
VSVESKFNNENGSSAKEITVLVCDDDSDTRLLVSSTISSLGFNVQTVVDGQEAIDFCRATLPDVIIMDVMMPRVTGFEFLVWLRKNVTTFVPVLLLTALEEVDHRVEGFEFGADDYMTKPFHWRELQARVEALLRIRNLMHKLEDRKSELEEANAELARTQSLLIKQERETTALQMAATAAHNLGQPMTTVMLDLYVIEKLIGKLQQGDSTDKTLVKSASDSLSTIKEQCNRMREIIASLQSLDPAKTQNYLGDVKLLDVSTRKK